MENMGVWHSFEKKMKPQLGESCRDWTGASIGIMLSFVMYCVDSPIRCIHFSVAENCYPRRLVEL